MGDVAVTRSVLTWFGIFCLSLAFCLWAIAAERSAKWDSVRDGIVRDHPYCALCSSTEDLEVHHKKPFHLHPELELAPSNCIVLCRHCHWWAGPGGVAWEVENDEIDEILNGVGELLYKKRLAILEERKAEKDKQP